LWTVFGWGIGYKFRLRDEKAGISIQRHTNQEPGTSNQQPATSNNSFLDRANPFPYKKHRFLRNLEKEENHAGYF
jgi:hypothetical protein